MINLSRAKELLIVLLPYLRGTNLYNALDAPELPGENEQFIKQQQDLSTRLHTTNANTKYVNNVVYIVISHNMQVLGLKRVFS
jgi:hypothetical protein